MGAMVVPRVRLTAIELASATTASAIHWASHRTGLTIPTRSDEPAVRCRDDAAGAQSGLTSTATIGCWAAVRPDESRAIMEEGRVFYLEPPGSDQAGRHLEAIIMVPNRFLMERGPTFPRTASPRRLAMLRTQAGSRQADLRPSRRGRSRRVNQARSLQCSQKIRAVPRERPQERLMYGAWLPPGMTTFLPCCTLVTSKSACASGIKRSSSPQIARTGALICSSRS